MSKPGPKPKPTKLKLLAGNPGNRPLNKNEPDFQGGLGAPPQHLSEEAVTEWLRVCDELDRTGVGTALDAATLAAYCQAYGRWVQAEETLAEMRNSASGLIIKTVSGNFIQNPIVGVANKAMADLVKYSDLFGMNPSSRTRISMGDGSTELNPFAALDGKRT